MCVSCKNGGQPIAAVWWRVSTSAQMELSPETQVAKARAVLESKGYMVLPEKVIGADWTSLEISACIPFQTLQRWVVNGEIHAVGMIDRDRLAAQGIQRLLFISLCREHRVEVVLAQGAPLLDGPEGQIVELALSIGKEASVTRAQLGSRDGLHARARLLGVPAVPVAPLGYSWDRRDKNDKHPKRLIPDGRHEIAQLIWDLALQGKTQRAIAWELTKRGFVTSTGKSVWNRTTVQKVLGNPAYAGRYYALRREATIPQNRRGDTYGKSSTRVKPSEEWVWVKGVLVAEPVVTWEDFQRVQDRMKLNKELALARATSKRFYLLSGMITCQLCGSRYFGWTHLNRWTYYVCDGYKSKPKGVARCVSRKLNAIELEDKVWNLVAQALTQPDIVLAKLRQKNGEASETEVILLKDLKALDRKWQELDNEEVELVALRVRKDSKGNPLVSDSALERNIALLKAQRAWVKEEQERIQAQLESLRRYKLTEDRLVEIRARIQTRLDSATPQDKRWVLECLNTRILAWPDHIITQIAVDVALEECTPVAPTPRGGGPIRARTPGPVSPSTQAPQPCPLEGSRPARRTPPSLPL